MKVEYDCTLIREFLAALYRQTDNEDGSFIIYRSDVLELAKDYGIKEEELKNENG